MVNKKISGSDLSLSLGTLDAPFALLGPEEYLKPDDWAWQFLRLKGDYKDDYAAALGESNPEDISPRGAFWITDRHPSRTVRVAERYCRKEYGLSTWLDPQHSRLPKLNAGESWFFPLRQAVDSPVVSGGDVPMEDVFSYYFVPQGRGVGDSRRSGVRKAIPANPEDRSKVWFAIDCSIPPAGQMTAVARLSEAWRECFMREKQKSHTGSNADSGIVPLPECSWFDMDKFKTASAVANSADPSLAWYTICVDVLGPIKEQLDSCSVLLNEKHQALYGEGIATEPILKRFRSELIGPRDVDGQILTDGHYLKALVICAQLAQKKLDASEIVEFIYRNASPSSKGKPEENGVRDKWVSNLEKRVVDYVKQAEPLVRWKYKWPVQAQKP